MLSSDGEDVGLCVAAYDDVVAIAGYTTGDLISENGKPCSRCWRFIAWVEASCSPFPGTNKNNAVRGRHPTPTRFFFTAESGM